MHERSICKSIVDMLLKELGKLDPPPRRVIKARVVVGELRQIAPDSLEPAYQSLTKGTLAEGSSLDIIPASVRTKCRTCGWEGPIPETRFQCPECKSSDGELVGGMELYLEGLDVEQQEHD